jgi:hypothetical protein
MKYLNLLFVLLISMNASAQEQIVPATISTMEHLHKLKKSDRSSTAKSGETLEIPFIDDFSVDHFPNNELGRQVFWEGRQATRNFGWGKNPPTLGVVSFDGADEVGYPYNWSPNNTGPADTLTSCPINLEYEGDDGIGLSFYYQPKGNAPFPPSPGDSLRVEFYAPDVDQWFWVWSTADISNTEEFSFAYIPITQSKYLKDGFKFRFRNIASLQGAFDTWNVDYIWLDQNFTNQNPINNDVAFQRQEYTFLEEYTRMPRDHFAENPAQFMRETIEVQLRNLNDGPRTLEGNKYRVVGDDVFEKSNPNSPSIAAQSSLDYIHGVATEPEPFVFDPSQSDTELEFDVEIIHGVSDYLPTSSNDTLRFKQQFFTEYARDDGQAEAGYSVPENGAEVAMEFTSYKTDSIFAVKIYTMPLAFDQESTVFNIRIWENTGEGPGAIIAEALQQVVNGIDDYQEQIVYTFDEPVLIPAGSFFVGYGQTNQFEGMKVGMDLNRDFNTSKLYYNVGSGWVQSAIPGTLLIRPMFTSNGWDDIIASTDDLDISNSIKIYPNPANDQVNILSEKFEIQSAEIYNSQGQLLSQESLFGRGMLNTAKLPNGLYLVVVRDGEGRSGTKKLLISR